MSKIRAIALVFAIVLASVPVSPAASAAPTAECSTTVVYDSFRFDNETVQQAANGSATAAAKNTEVRVEQTAGFMRVHGENPNGYCIEFRVQISPQVVSPAELGSVDSNDEQVEAGWHATRDISRDETYTEVVFQLPPNSSATFAPSKIRVQSLAWTGTATQQGGSLLERVTNFSIGEEPALRNRTYTFSAENDSEYVTVPLEDPNSDREIKEWTAMYKTAGTDWRPVTKEAGAPVFYREPKPEQVQFVFNDQNATVRFRANPTPLEKAQTSWQSWTSGWSAISDLLGDDTEENN